MRTHLASGLLLALVFFKALNLKLCEFGEALAYSLLGSFFPDLDLKWGHRRNLHNIPAVVILTGALLYLANQGIVSKLSPLFFSASYTLHLLLDSLTFRGVAFLFPFKKKTYGLKICKTGGLLDKTLRLLFTVASVALVAYQLSKAISFLK